MELLEIQQLLIGTQEGKEEAFESLCEWMLPSIRMTYFKFYFEDVELEDFIVEAEWLLYSIASTFSLEKVQCFYPYYRKSLQRLAYRMIRVEKKKRRIPKQLITFDYNDEMIEDYHNEQADDMLIKEEQAMKYMQSLSDLERKVAERMEDGISKEEIALQVGKPLKSVRNVVSRCRIKFFKLFHL